MDIKKIPTKELEKELATRTDRAPEYCPKCGGKWTTYMGAGRNLRLIKHCHGCRKPVEICTC